MSGGEEACGCRVGRGGRVWVQSGKEREGEIEYQDEDEGWKASGEKG